MLLKSVIACAAVGLAALTPAVAQQLAAPVELRCEYRENPLGIDVVRPRLSWKLPVAPAPVRGRRQTAYQVQAASSLGALMFNTGDLWDTQRLPSDQSVHVEYAGKPLTSGKQVFWRVRYWDENGAASDWSAPAQWSMGLLNASDWKATWIGRDEKALLKNPRSPYRFLRSANWIWAPERTADKVYIRGVIELPQDRKLKQVLCVAGADARYNLSINETAVGRGESPWMPEVYDVTRAFKPGVNIVAIEGTPHARRQPALIGSLYIVFEDGEEVVLPSSPEMRWSKNAPANWKSASFNDSAWSNVKVIGAYGMEPWGEVGYNEERYVPARMLRKQFTLTADVLRATAYVSGLGIGELYLNGRKVGDHVLSPGLTDYSKRVLYVAYDVTSLLKKGDNAAGIWLGNGRYWAPRVKVPIGTVSYGYPKAIAQIEVEYANGTRGQIVTDASWKLTANGPIASNNEYDGEEYDARKEIPNWASAGFDDSAWEPAQAVSAPAGGLHAQMAEPLRVTQTLKPVKITEPIPGHFVFDMGQNMVGWCRLRVSGPAGTVVHLRHAESVKPDGTLYVDNLRSARAEIYYTLKGGGMEIYEPRFTYHGFRFVEVTGYPGKPPIDAIEGRVVHDAMTPVADFVSSNSLLNRIHENIVWGMRGNYRSIPTDCPQRDERQGWLGDRSMVSRSESYMFDVAALYTKWTTDLADSQLDTGSIPDVAPAFWTIYSNNVTWPSTLVLVPNMLYDQYGDKRVIERAYPTIKRWIDFMRGFMKDDLLPKDTYGDWCVPPESPTLIHSEDPARRTDKTLIGSAYFQYLLRVVARNARMIGKDADAAEYEALANRIAVAYNKAFYDASKGYYSNGTQTSGVLSLALGLVTPNDRRRLLNRLEEKIEKESNDHVGVGLVGAQWLMRTLSENGLANTAYSIATKTTYPGWGYMVDKGATTIWELWNGDTADPAMNSGNHVMQVGDLGVWMYEYLAGIRTDSAAPGFKRTILKPFVAGDLTSVSASHVSMYGKITSAWKRNGKQFNWAIAVPPNTKAEVWVPAAGAAAVAEGGHSAQTAPGFRFLKSEAGYAVFEVEAGSYTISSTL